SGDLVFGEQSVPRRVGREVQVDDVAPDGGMGGEEFDHARTCQTRAAFDVQVRDSGGRRDGQQCLVVDEGMRDVQMRQVRQQREERFENGLLQRGAFV
ncbi:hypothetical protein PHISCL_11004, partial [Aspergillus sclerotialis]